MLTHSLRIVAGLLAIAAMMISLTHYSAEAQTIPIPEFKPKAPEVQGNGSGQMEPEAEPEPPRPADYAMKVQLEPHENEFLEADGWYQVSNFAIATSNSSELCPTGNCEFDLDGGEMSGEGTPGERHLTGKLRIDTGGPTKIMNLDATWQTIEEREQDGERVQVIEGTLNVGRGDEVYINPEYQSQINGTLVPDGNGLLLEAHGTAGSPYTYTE
jgi:hypothetical protein